VVKAGDHNFIAGVEPVRQAPADVQGERGHVVAEDDLLRAGGVQEIRHGGMRFFQDGIGLPAGGKSTVVVGVALQQVTLDALSRLPGDLGTAGVVEEDGRAVERGELFADEG
jgi:hypothetical protein